MPFFGKKFTPIKCTPRKKLPFHTEKVSVPENREQIQLKLGDQVLVFDKGKWKSVDRGQKELLNENNHLKKLTTELREENNLLTLKIELLLDMLTDQTIGGEKVKRK